MQHFNDYKNNEDRIIHLLVAAICEGDVIYKQVINECINTYGEETTNAAVSTFKQDYISLIKRLT